MEIPDWRVYNKAAAIGSDGCIYVPSDEREHYMYAINPDGTLRWKYPIGWATTPVIGADGTLYFGSDIGYLYALAPEKPTKVESTPISFSVKSPRPNPFNPSTTIEYTLSSPAPVKLEVYSATGQKVATLVDEKMSAGTHAAVFDGAGCASGVYFYRFEAGGMVKCGKDGAGEMNREHGPRDFPCAVCVAGG